MKNSHSSIRKNGVLTLCIVYNHHKQKSPPNNEWNIQKSTWLPFEWLTGWFHSSHSYKSYLLSLTQFNCFCCHSSEKFSKDDQSLTKYSVTMLAFKAGFSTWLAIKIFIDLWRIIYRFVRLLLLDWNTFSTL